LILLTGPSHKKNFTVCLKLGDTEEYLATGQSIKKAQHAAAAMALEKTKLKHPSPKSRTTTKTGKTCRLPEYRVQISKKYLIYS
jgi:double-stranded RNA-binding protein Staufen